MERPRLSAVDSPLLSIVIPAFNEASRITATLERVTAYLRERAISAEVLVVDDGSVDDTVDLAEAFAGSSPPVRTIWLAHRGKGAAVKAGMLLAKGEYRFLCDADLSMPIEQIERFLDRIDRFDIVIGSREAAGARRLDEPASDMWRAGGSISSSAPSAACAASPTPSVGSRCSGVRLRRTCLDGNESTASASTSKSCT